jgi:predicted nucleic acid-binding protein
VFILDTCILNILFHYPGAKRDAVIRQLSAVDRDTVYISAISLHEMIVMGLCPQIPQRLNTPTSVRNLRFLTDLIPKLAAYQVLHYTEDDEEYFERRISAAAKRAGPMDCRIAASAISHDYIVVTEDDEAFDLAGAQHANWADLTL